MAVENVGASVSGGRRLVEGLMRNLFQKKRTGRSRSASNLSKGGVWQRFPAFRGPGNHFGGDREDTNNCGFPRAVALYVPDMFEVIQLQLPAVAEKISHLRRFL
jgi:hypothetical protein